MVEAIDFVKNIQKKKKIKMGLAFKRGKKWKKKIKKAKVVKMMSKLTDFLKILK